MLRNKINQEKLPKHIGIILDGNGRWAQKRGLPRELGHQAGIEAVKNVVYAAKELNIKVISMFAFSTENWKRSKKEVDFIFNLLRKYFNENENEYLKNNIQLRTMGDISALPEDIYKKLVEVKEKTKNCDGIIVNLALNYGGRDDIVRAVKNIISDNVLNIDEQTISNYLYTAGLPDPDFIIRTSGEQRLSNFMMYQSAYSEFYFPKVHWPDFDKKELTKAIITYQRRDRRFGGIKEKNK